MEVLICNVSMSVLRCLIFRLKMCHGSHECPWLSLQKWDLSQLTNVLYTLQFFMVDFQLLVLYLRLSCRTPCHSFTCHLLRITFIVLCLDLQSLLTHVNEVDQSGCVFCSCSVFTFNMKKPLISSTSNYYLLR